MASAPLLGHKALTVFMLALSCAPAALPSVPPHVVHKGILGFFKSRDVNFKKVRTFLR